MSEAKLLSLVYFICYVHDIAKTVRTRIIYTNFAVATALLWTLVSDHPFEISFLLNSGKIVLEFVSINSVILSTAQVVDRVGLEGNNCSNSSQRFSIGFRSGLWVAQKTHVFKLWSCYLDFFLDRFVIMLVQDWVYFSLLPEYGKNGIVQCILTDYLLVFKYTDTETTVSSSQQEKHFQTIMIVPR